MPSSATKAQDPDPRDLHLALPVRGFGVVVVGSSVLGSVHSVVLEAPSAATITPAPSADVLAKRQDSPDAISLAQILLTAIPASLRQIAATNIPAVSSILWEEFLDDKRPEWFLELPEDIQSYLIRKFGPQTAWPTEPPTSQTWEWSSATATTTSDLEETSEALPSSTSESATGTATTSAAGTQDPESTASTDPTTLVSSTRSTPSSSKATQSPSKSTQSSSPSSSDPSNTSTSTTSPDAPPTSNSGLSKSQKIGLGLGIPFGLLGAAALFLGCCMLLRRRQKKNVDGSIPPSSPGFIPRFAFHERQVDDVEHRTPLNPAVNQAVNYSTQDLGHTAWDDEGVDPMDAAPMHNPYTMKSPYTMDDYESSSNQPSAGMMLNDPAPVHHSPAGGMTMHDPKPIMAPALFHTHSSNRARGMRTSYTSLHSVAEVTEPDETESPVLGRQISPKQSPARNLMPTPPIPAGATIKRKPVSSPPPMPATPPVSASPAAKAASRTLLRQTMPEHSGSSSSGLALTTSSGFNSSSSGLGAHADMPSPVSPISNRAPSNPFNYDSYVEDYGPEYQGEYVDVEDGLYGGHTSLSRYPESRRKSLKTEWPLRNMVGSGHRRKSSPLWDRIYEE
ncbi:hypothetical protein K458DRAFT_384280 [Lentithecium fluviatile CBS 122367]|uniref:Uncharacterized protein n=1 Tax=Lentithecium fluviatile CBS 122367 TaxID=1168545 RepID=A0A6G1JHN7_9PLEO|nr:hypothetical protein K458DRAFT_384280 [Lentithecium fluviatile CBS 122367]